MISLDIAPYYPDAEYVHRVELVADYEFSKPPKQFKKTTDVHPYLLVEPSKVDFRKPTEEPLQLLNWVMKGEDPIPYMGDMPRED